MRYVWVFLTNVFRRTYLVSMYIVCCSTTLSCQLDGYLDLCCFFCKVLGEMCLLFVLRRRGRIPDTALVLSSSSRIVGL